MGFQPHYIAKKEMIEINEQTTTKVKYPFYHTINIHGAGYPERDEEGRYISPYRLWHELHRFIPKESEVEEG